MGDDLSAPELRQRWPRPWPVLLAAAFVVGFLVWQIATDRLSTTEHTLVGSWTMAREYTSEDEEVGHADFSLVLNSDRSFEWSWRDRETDAGSTRPWIGRWWMTNGDRLTLHLRGDELFFKRILNPSNESAHFLDSVDANEFVWINSGAPETFRRIDQTASQE